MNKQTNLNNQVKVVVHNNAAGYKVSKAKIAPTPRTTPRVRFPPIEVLMDATARGDADTVNYALYLKTTPPKSKTTTHQTENRSRRC